MKLKKLNIKKKVLLFIGCVAMGITAVTITKIPAKAYGYFNSWDIYNSDEFVEKGLDSIFTKSVKNDPSKGNGAATHIIKIQMDYFNNDWYDYTIKNSLTNGTPIGDPANPEYPTDPVMQDSNLFVNTTFYTDSSSKKYVSGWYASKYGPLIDAEVGDDGTAQENIFSNFDKIAFPNGGSRVYVASNEPKYYLRDAKTAATLYGYKYPILISNSSSSDSTNLVSNASNLKAKHMIFMGGTGTNSGPAAFDALTGIGANGIDMVRIGGTNASQTARYLQQLPSNVYDSPEKPENNIGQFYSLTADSHVSSSLVSELTTKLKDNDFTGAVKLALSSDIGDATMRNESNIQNGIPSLILGGFDQDNPPKEASENTEKYLKVYLCKPSTGQIVFQYFESGFDFTPVQPVTSSVTLDIKSSPQNAGVLTGGGTQDLDSGGKTKFTGITQIPGSKAPSNSHWVFDHWGTLYGDNVTPDASGNVTITQNTCLVAYYKLATSTSPTQPNETSTLSSTASVKASWYNKDDKQKSDDFGATIAKEGQLVTFTVNTSSDDYISGITDSLDWQSAHTPVSINYNKDGFTGTLEGQDEESYDFGTWQYDGNSTKWVSNIKYRQNYKGTVYRSPISNFSATEARLYFPDGLVNTDPADQAKLNPAIKDNLNVDPVTPYLEHYVTSIPTYSSGFDDGQIWKNNIEKVEFYVPMTTPVTIRDLSNNGGTERAHNPYKIRIEVREPSGQINNCYVDLDIRGNIYQNIYDTPVE